IVLWSVVRSRLRKTEPLVVGRAGYRRLTMGAGAMVTVPPAKSCGRRARLAAGPTLVSSRITPAARGATSGRPVGVWMPGSRGICTGDTAWTHASGVDEGTRNVHHLAADHRADRRRARPAARPRSRPDGDRRHDRAGRGGLTGRRVPR